MQRLTAAILASFVLAAFAVACDDTEQEDDNGQTEQQQQQEDTFETMEVDELGVTIDAPPDTEFGDPAIGEGVSIETDELFGLAMASILTVDDSMPASEDEWIEDLEDTHDIQDIDITELDNGWIAAYSTENSRGETRYRLESYHEIDGEEYHCASGAMEMERNQELLESICETLR